MVSCSKVAKYINYSSTYLIIKASHNGPILEDCIRYTSGPGDLLLL